MVCRTDQGQDANTVAAMTNHLFQRIRQAAEGIESHKLLETPAGSYLTYADMLGLSGRYAAALSELGAKPGERIAAQIEKSPDAIMLYLGAIRAGVIFLPLNTDYTHAELATERSRSWDRRYSRHHRKRGYRSAARRVWRGGRGNCGAGERRASR